MATRTAMVSARKRAVSVLCIAVGVAACMPGRAGAQEQPPATEPDAAEEKLHIEVVEPVRPPEYLDPLPTAPAPAQCVPSCRRNYVCVAGRCVSECNPPCGAGEACQAGECVSREPPFPAVPAPEWPEYRDGLQPYEPRARRHKGFFLRLDLGVGGGMVERDTGPRDVELSGLATFFSVDVGGAPVENFILHARFSNAVMSDPELDVDGGEFEDDLDASLSFVMLGGGLTYYIMPINIYVTAVGGAMEATVTDNGFILADSDLGYGLEFDLGKEWWVASNLGIGLAGRVLYVNVPPDDDTSDDHLDGFIAGALFSATFN